MRISSKAILLSLLLAACQTVARPVKAPPLDAEAEAWVYLEGLPAAGERLRFVLDSVTLVRSDGQEFPLALDLPEVSGGDAQRQRLLAHGRVAPGEYEGLQVRVRSASLGGGDDGTATLLVSGDPVRVPVPVGLRRGQSRLISLVLRVSQSLDKGFGFRPSFLASVPALPVVELLGFASDTGSDVITVFDKQSLRVCAVIPTGRDPRGLALDRLQGRLYVALSGADEVAAHDLVTGVELGRARLQPGDRPQELALSGDGRSIVVTNAGSNSVSFVDPASLTEVGRARTGLVPTALLLDRGGRRAYAFNQGSSAITVVDIAGRAAVATIPTEGPPSRGAMNRAGDRLYVVASGSPSMVVYSVPAHAVVNRLQVGFGAVSVNVDPRTDYTYVSAGDTGEIQVFAALSPLPVARLSLPEPATWLAIDDAYDRLLLVSPRARTVGGMELTSRKLVPALDAGTDPYAVIVVGERR